MGERPREYCASCEEPTGRAGRGEDSMCLGDNGPYCEACFPGEAFDEIESHWRATEKRLRAELAALRALADDPPLQQFIAETITELGLDDTSEEADEAVGVIRNEVLALRARLAPTASDEQRARELAESVPYAAFSVDDMPRCKDQDHGQAWGDACFKCTLAAIAQALGAARQQGAEQEREALWDVLDDVIAEVDANENDPHSESVTAEVLRRYAAAIRARGGSE